MTESTERLAPKYLRMPIEMFGSRPVGARIDVEMEGTGATLRPLRLGLRRPASDLLVVAYEVIEIDVANQTLLLERMSEAP